MQRDELSQWLVNHYRPQEFRDHIHNGLLFEGKEKVKKGISAVSFSLAAVQKAAEMDADFLIVHHAHGFWDNQARTITGGFKKKLSVLLENNISLYGFHLPMDSQPETGNNAGLSEALGLKKVGGFLPNGSRQIGLIASLNKAISFAEFKLQITKVVGPIHAAFHSGSELIQTVAICTGAAASSIAAAKATGADIFISGEPREESAIYCEEETFNFIAAGHHRTEVFGPRLIAERISQELQLPTQFIDIHNPV